MTNDQQDERFTLTLVSDLLDVLAAHGYVATDRAMGQSLPHVLRLVRAYEGNEGA
jgi:hypothetical protein